MHPLFLAFDPYLIWFYRFTAYASLNFFLGTLALALHSLALGELTLALVSVFVKKYLAEIVSEAAKYQKLSEEALKAGDMAAYRAANKLANDAFGKSFFLNLALSAAFLWPVPLALAWMQPRFLELAFPLPFLPLSLGYVGIFILCYIAAYILWKTARRRVRQAGAAHAAKSL